MITDADVEKLKGVFSTKDDLIEVRDDLTEVREGLGDLKLEVGELHDKVDSIDVKIDSLAGMIQASLEEHGAGAVHLARHDRQIAALAVHTGTTLSE